MDVELSTSPRATWLWAVDVDQARELRSLLEAAGCSVSGAVGRNAEPRVLDLDIGVVAYEALEVLRRVGYSFRWHSQQSELNRSTDLYGIPVSAPDGA